MELVNEIMSIFTQPLMNIGGDPTSYRQAVEAAVMTYARPEPTPMSPLETLSSCLPEGSAIRGCKLTSGINGGEITHPVTVIPSSEYDRLKAKARPAPTGDVGEVVKALESAIDVCPVEAKQAIRDAAAHLRRLSEQAAVIPIMCEETRLLREQVAALEARLAALRRPTDPGIVEPIDPLTIPDWVGDLPTLIGSIHGLSESSMVTGDTWRMRAVQAARLLAKATQPPSGDVAEVVKALEWWADFDSIGNCPVAKYYDGNADVPNALLSDAAAHLRRLNQLNAKLLGKVAGMDEVASTQRDRIAALEARLAAPAALRRPAPTGDHTELIERARRFAEPSYRGALPHTATDDMFLSLADALAASSAQLSDANEQADQAAAEVDRLRRELATATAERDALNEKLAVSDAMLVGMTAKRDECANERDAWLERYQQLGDEVDALKAQPRIEFDVPASEPMTADKLEPGTVFQCEEGCGNAVVLEHNKIMWLDEYEVADDDDGEGGWTVVKILGTLGPDGVLVPYTGPQPGAGKVKLMDLPAYTWFVSARGAVGIRGKNQPWLCVVGGDNVGPTDEVTPLLNPRFVGMEAR